MHETDPGTVGASAAVEIYSLDEGTGTVTYTDNSNSDLSHSVKANNTLPAVNRSGQGTKVFSLKNLPVLPVILTPTSGVEAAN